MDIVHVTTREFDTKAYTYSAYKRVCEILKSYTRDQTMELYKFINSINKFFLCNMYTNQFF